MLYPSVALTSSRYTKPFFLISALLLLCSVAFAQFDHSDDALRNTPIPETAQGPAIDFEKGYIVEEIEDGLYWVGDGAYMTMFLVSDEGVVVVDAPPTLGENLLNAVAEVTDQPITHLVYSHEHGDHIGAANLFSEDVTVIAHEETQRLLERGASCTDCLGERPLPDITFSDTYLLTVGNQVLELHYEGPNHQPGNIFIYAPNQQTLMLVDVIYPGWVPFQNLAISQDIPGWLDAYETALGFPFETFIGGHVNRPGTRADVEVQYEYVTDVRQNAQDALQSVDRPGFVTELGQEAGFGNVWFLFGEYTDFIAQTCADATLDEWAGRLGGVEVFTYSHCTMMQFSERVD